ncbi:MAG: outer membrane beta-barrel protein [Bacteroidetes bacterium]|nr:outer membrane beta-barrel protein [Bacteroidota bacterium]
MEESYNDITKSFTGKIESYEMPVSKKVWESLDHQLDKKASNKYRVALRLRLMLASFIFLITSFGLYFLLEKISKPKAGAISKHETVVPVISDSKNNNVLLPANNYGNKLKAKKTESTGDNLSNDTDSKLTGNTVMRKNYSTQVDENEKMNSVSSNDKAVVTNITKNTLIEQTNKKTDTLLIVEGIIVPGSAPVDSTIQINRNNNVTPISDIKVDASQAAITKVVKSDSAAASPISDLKPENKFIHRISIIGYFSPDFTKKYLIDANSNNDSQTQSEYDGKETPDFSFNTGLLIGYDLSSKWTLKTGAAYTYLMQSISPKVIYAKTGIDGQQHYQFKTSYGNAQIQNDASPAPQSGDSLKINTTSTQLLQMINVPFLAKYQMRHNKFSYYAQFGLSLNFLIGEKLLVEAQNRLETISNLEGLKQFNLGGIVGCGVSYSPVKKLSIIVEPTFRSSLSSINQKSSFKVYPYSLGISLGLGWHL